MTDFSQEFLPPIQNLVAENTPWGGNLTQWKPFSSQLNGDLYQNMARNGPTQGEFGSGQNPFVVSAMGNPDRAMAAQQSWRENQAMLLPPSQFMQNNPLYPYNNASLTYLASNSPNIGPPQYGGDGVFDPFISQSRQTMYESGMAQLGQSNLRDTMFNQMAGQLNQMSPTPTLFDQQKNAAMQAGLNASRPDFPRNPNSNGVDNVFDYTDTRLLRSGYDRLVAGLEGADIFSQGNVKSRALDQMAGWLNDPRSGGNDPVSEATETISKLAKVMKEDLVPATKDYTEKVGSLVGVMRGGSGAGGGAGDIGGFGGGVGIGGGTGGFGGGGDAGGGGWGDWLSGMGRRAGNALLNLGGQVGDAIGGADIKGLPLFRMRQANSIFIKPMMNEMNEYMNQTATQDLGMLQSGIMNYGDLMGGQYGDIKRRQIAGEEWSYNLGQQVYNAYGGIANAALGGDAANGVLGAAIGIGSPAIGAGMLGGAIGGMVGLGGPIGLLAGAGTAIVGSANYAYNASQNMVAVGQQQVNTESQRRSGNYNINALFNNVEGVVGDYTAWWRNELGTLSPEESQRYENAGQYYDLSKQYSQGGLTRSQFATQLEGTGYTLGEGLVAGQELFFEQATKLGMNRGQAQNFLSYWQRYNPNTPPTGQQAIDWQSLTLSGVDLGKTVGAYGASLGISPSDQGGMDLANGDVSRWLLNLPEGTNKELASEGIYNTAQSFASGNAARRRAGLSDFNTLNFQSDMYKQNPGMVDATGAWGVASGNYGLTSPSFFTNVVQPMGEEAGYGQPGAQFDVKKYFQRQEGWRVGSAIYNRGIDYGNNSPALVEATKKFADLDPDSQRLAVLVGTGDRMALSQNWQMLGDERYKTIDPETGLGVFEKEKRSLQDSALATSRGLDTYQYGMATSARNISYQMMTGGSTGVGAQGFALGGDGLQGLSALFQAQGMNLQTGNGMGMWQVQDAQVALSRQQQQFGIGQQGMGRDLANRQWNESFAMNQQQFNLQTAYQSQNMTIGRGQQVVQQGWQSQDMAMDRNRMELSYGWQQEDFDRNIRFARGRQRIDLMRQQERSAITHSMDETQQGNEEARFKTETQWNKEEFDRKKTYFEQNKILAQEEMNMNKRHHDETMALQKEAYDKSKEWMTQEWALQDQIRLLSRQSDELEYKTATELAEAARQAQLQLIAVSDQLKTIGREEQDREGFIDVNVGKGNAFVGGVNAVTPSTPAPKPITPAPKHVPGGGYKEGGYTGTGDPNTVAGVTHYNEYVVPEGGALVLRGGGGNQDTLLAEVIAVLRQILARTSGQTTIYANDPNIQRNSQYQAALAKTH